MPFRVTIVLLLAGLLPPTAPAQSGQQFRQRLAEVRDTLTLTREQTEKIIPILMEEFRGLRAVREKYGDPAAASRSDRMQRLRDAAQVERKADKQLNEILDDKQEKALEKLREEWRKERRSRQGQTPAPAAEPL